MYLLSRGLEQLLGAPMQEDRGILWSLISSALVLIGYAVYRFRCEEVTCDESDKREDEHQPECEMPSKAGILYNETSDNRSDY